MHVIEICSTYILISYFYAKEQFFNSFKNIKNRNKLTLVICVENKYNWEIKKYI